MQLKEQQRSHPEGEGEARYRTSRSFLVEPKWLRIVDFLNSSMRKQGFDQMC